MLIAPADTNTQHTLYFHDRAILIFNYSSATRLAHALSRDKLNYSVTYNFTCLRLAETKPPRRAN